MNYKDCLQQIQKFLENSPLVIIGSGSSADYGLPLMGELSDVLKKHSAQFDETEFTSLLANLTTMNLEDAIDKSTLSEGSLDVLRRIVWEYVNERDFAQFYKLLQDKRDYPLAELLRIVIGTAANTATIITTNYDRLVEYAVDIIGATAITGFEGNLIKALEFPQPAVYSRRIRARERVVNVWKVHGSLDWFINTNNECVSIPLSPSIPLNHKPLIIAPGKTKYNITHGEPYRDIITQADSAFSNAGSFLCIGYGFNDDHIQPKLIKQINNRKPIVVLCRTATDACKRYVVTEEVKKYAIIERSMDDKTTVTIDGSTENYDGSFWRLPDFIKTVWR